MMGIKLFGNAFEALLADRTLGLIFGIFNGVAHLGLGLLGLAFDLGLAIAG